MYVSSVPLSNGESVGMSVLEVTSIPHFSILSEQEIDENSLLEENYLNTANLLTEVYQKYKHLNIKEGGNHDISFEILWLTEAVENQTYKAKIRFFIVVRYIDHSQDAISQVIGDLMDIVKVSLDIQRYECQSIKIDEYESILSSIDNQQVTAIVKEEKVDWLQNNILPTCYSYDIIRQSNHDLSKIVSALTNYPNCAISFQLIPAYFTLEEINELGQTTQQLDMLSKGINDVSVGNVSFALANKHAENYKYYIEHKDKPLFNFNILIFANNTANSNLQTKVYGQINYSGTTSCNLAFVDLPSSQADYSNNLYPLPWAVNECLVNNYRDAGIWQSGSVSPNFFRLANLITVEEAAEFNRLPFGNDRIQAGLVVNRSSKSLRSYSDNVINAGDIEIGRLKSSAKGDTIGVTLKDLAKHMLVVGTPGSGKTTFSVSLLDRLWKDHHIPFIVIEPAKNEYRALIQSIPDLQLFTPGKNFISPFVFNPFVPPKNVKLESYKSTLKTAFAAGVSMTSPLDKIFEETINNCYSDFRWLDSYTKDDAGKVFNIMDFIKCFQETFNEIGYTGDARNIGRAGIVRLQSLISLFDNYYSIPIEDILSKPTVIELAAIENSDQKSLLISLILLSIYAYVNANYLGEGGLKNVILLEEAHVLLDAHATKQKGEADPSQIAQSLLKRMLAEIRSYGVGLVIADQSPRKVGMDVVALTDVKMAFRLVEGEDKEILSRSTNMDDVMTDRLSRLKPGEAVMFFGKLNEPEEVVTEDYRLQNKISITLSDAGIKELSTYWDDKQHFLRPYPECEHVPYCSKHCDRNRRNLAKEVARRIARRHFKANTTGFKELRYVFANISALIKAELNSEEFNRELLSCVKAHLWRRIVYNTEIDVSTETIIKSLEKL